MGKVRVGLSGWSYDAWHGPFYPQGVTRTGELKYAARVFESLEVNGSFYALLRPETYAEWFAQTPRNFVFSIKGSRFISHNKKLKNIDVPLANFLASGLLRLGHKLGPIVWQLAENIKFDEDRMHAFLALLPSDTGAAACLAAKHDRRVAGRNWTKPLGRHRVRHAIEVRNESFFVPAFARLLRQYGVALVVSDSATWPLVEQITSGFLYLRLHGSKQTYHSRYSDAELDRWAKRIRSWNSGREPRDAVRFSAVAPPPRTSRDVYVYFDNTDEGHAPSDAMRLRRRLERTNGTAQAARPPSTGGGFDG